MICEYCGENIHWEPVVFRGNLVFHKHCMEEIKQREKQLTNGSQVVSSVVATTLSMSEVKPKA